MRAALQMPNKPESNVLYTVQGRSIQVKTYAGQTEGMLPAGL